MRYTWESYSADAVSAGLTLMFLFAALQILDLYFARVIISLGGYEANPLMGLPKPARSPGSRWGS